MATKFSTFIVIIRSIELICTSSWVTTFGDMNGGNLEIILCLSRCMRSKEEAVSCVWFIKVSTSWVGKVVISM